jgi:hypothetical protein
VAARIPAFRLFFDAHHDNLGHLTTALEDYRQPLANAVALANGWRGLINSFSCIKGIAPLYAPR